MMNLSETAKFQAKTKLKASAGQYIRLKIS